MSSSKSLILDLCRLALKPTSYWFHAQDLVLNQAEETRSSKPRRYFILLPFVPSAQLVSQSFPFQAGEDALRRSGLGYTIIRPGPLQVTISILMFMFMFLSFMNLSMSAYTPRHT